MLNLIENLKGEVHDFSHNSKILYSVNKALKLNLLETLEINKMRPSDLLSSDQLDLPNSPILNLFP